MNLPKGAIDSSLKIGIKIPLGIIVFFITLASLNFFSGSISLQSPVILEISWPPNIIFRSPFVIRNGINFILQLVLSFSVSVKIEITIRERDKKFGKRRKGIRSMEEIRKYRSSTQTFPIFGDLFLSIIVILLFLWVITIPTVWYALMAGLFYMYYTVMEIISEIIVWFMNNLYIICLVVSIIAISLIVWKFRRKIKIYLSRIIIILLKKLQRHHDETQFFNKRKTERDAEHMLENFERKDVSD